MSIARVTMHEYVEENFYQGVDALYQTVRKKYFPSIEQTINIKKGPTSGISISLYPSFEDAASNLEYRTKMMEFLLPFIKESFYHEGEVTMNIID